MELTEEDLNDPELLSQYSELGTFPFFNNSHHQGGFPVDDDDDTDLSDPNLLKELWALDGKSNIPFSLFTHFQQLNRNHQKKSKLKNNEKLSLKEFKNTKKLLSPPKLYIYSI